MVFDVHVLVRFTVIDTTSATACTSSAAVSPSSEYIHLSDVCVSTLQPVFQCLGLEMASILPLLTSHSQPGLHAFGVLMWSACV